MAFWPANRLYATTGCPNCVCQPVIRHNRLSKLCLPFGCPDANGCAMHLVRSMKNMAAYQLNSRHQHGPLACLLRTLRSSLDQMKGVPYGLTPKRGRLTTGCLATGCGQLAWQPVARHNRLPTSGLATGCPPQPVVQIPFDTIWAPPVAELIAWFSKIDYPTLDTPWCIPEHRGASQSTAVHPSSPWGPGQAPLHACMCVCARCLPTPCGVSWCPPLQPSYPSCSQTHPVTHLCPRRLRLPRKVPAAPGESSLLSLSLISL